MAATRRTGEADESRTAGDPGTPGGVPDGPVPGEGPPPPSAPPDPLEPEIACYLQHLPGWRAHRGAHVLIHAREVCGFYPTREEALAEGFRRFGRVAFLVKQVDPDEMPRPLVGIVL